MTDPRWKKLADVLIDYSIKLRKEEVVVIFATDAPEEMVALLIKKIYEVGGIPLIVSRNERELRAYIKDTNEATMRLYGEVELSMCKRAKAAIFLVGSPNLTELSDVPTEKMDLYIKYRQGPVIFDWIVNNLRWVLLNWPLTSLAQAAEMSTEAFEDFFFQSCTMDYSRMSAAMDPLVELMRRTDRVRLVSPGTDLEFSIKEIPVIKCAGEMNLPDGEVFTAPVRDSINGTIRYNTRTSYLGKVYDSIAFKFKDGRIVDSTSSRTEEMNAVLDTDEGARYVGEFAIGVNPYVTKPMLNILFDEKIAGSIHLTPGNAYDVAPNGNKSLIHWDLVLIQTKKWGGGEIYFDGKLVRKDGLFVVDELLGLNPENLMSKE
jgi:aminopeptidase